MSLIELSWTAKKGSNPWSGFCNFWPNRNLCYTFFSSNSIDKVIYRTVLGKNCKWFSVLGFTLATSDIHQFSQKFSFFCKSELQFPWSPWELIRPFLQLSANSRKFSAPSSRSPSSWLQWYKRSATLSHNFLSLPAMVLHDLSPSSRNN